MLVIISQMSKISANILALALISTINAIPVGATSLKNIPHQEYQSLVDSSKFSVKDDALKLPPRLQDVLGKNRKNKNQIQRRFFAEAENTISQVQQASTVTEETIDGKRVYLYNLESPKSDKSFPTKQIYTQPYLSRLKLPQAPPKRKISEPGTVIAVMAVFCIFVTQKRLCKSKLKPLGKV
ncbi:hypothetical protein [Calothrix sp. UHCC 0171]|uniref:hypothetical protein n=1 Tax=Calothrix sp. UHCC 0171 TaxID=3110245 RepID=UPI002B1F5FD0|nr:hypothetical protein [Calothrix sp. UHCC 0171]MEA5573735.1 hypothetical protein [Calothrix sp. UHCC 0171]